MTHTTDTPFVDWDDFHLTVELLAKVREEMEAQDAKWGEQNHPLISRDPEHDAFLRAGYAEMADELKRLNDEDARYGATSWAGVLGEEFYEALAEDDPGLACAELIQVAAVALQMVKSIGRHGLVGA